MRAAVLALVAACVGLSVLAPGASAHAGLVASDPASGVALGSTPSAVRLTFSERIEPSLSRVTVRSRTGRVWASGVPTPAAGDPLSLTLSVPPLPRGVYTVDWRVDSAVDGHETRGVYGFGVEVPAALVGATQPRTVTPVSSPLEVIARWLFLVGLVALIGALAAALGDFGSPRLGAYGWLVAAIGLILLAYAQRRSAGSSFGTLLDSGVGHALIGRAVALAAAGVGLLVAWRAGWPAGWQAGLRAPPSGLRTAVHRGALVFAAVAALTTIVIHVANGHAAAAGSWPTALTVASQAVHFSVAGIWIGGLAALLLRIRGEPSSAKAAAVRRFSLLAAAGLALITATGILRAFSELRSWGELFSTGYGRGVVAKLVLVGLIALVASRSRRRGVPAASSDLRPLRRSARTELALAAGALVVAALLGTLGPPVSVAFSGLRGLSASGVDTTQAVRVVLRAGSDQPGPNAFTVKVSHFSSGDPVTGAAVSMRFTPLDDPTVPGSSLSLAPAGHGTYTGAGDNMSFDGRWGVLVVVQHSHGGGAVGVPLELDTATPPEQSSIQRVPGQFPIYSKLVGNLGIVSISPHPERAGRSSLLVGCYTPSLGDPIPIRSIVVTLSTDGAPPQQQSVTPTGRGTFTASVKLAAGRDEIAVVAHTTAGVRLRSVFDIDVPGG